MSERHEHRLKRLKMRSMRRGIKEMDLILSAYADDTLHTMDDAALTLYDDMLNENDQDLYQWVTGQVAAPERFAGLIARISVQFQGSAA
ncbi:succinate dehydrogenase assembly factor 2 [Sulfitobacter pseudonitzschiae]|uniref:FAD assembly factor SdhE n=1 Tax=Pseudosulfitobacter pseudonitzschiae TaxID=1402135 RepID=A0A9Q2NQI8_9RHOB|nr:succinate dehydrogenase assembly factor 2 [Pseudosulfitobacter pseudonitzschiae]MBM2292422.1 succinate dehydrogenase assembly factor 2 [Pseudosulfitobacter pseudonitzschiae]MBM2297340.1 succinate dehydrogenase assembly factor 2 [Pseudosulfitobacter pseudonitzschiae]MBM2302254.1 succinate dehydrogenase assembly factor 2 [Pseudosulfitobacter pseudonitzschiae]MBM2312036.1 succinate dehydrogenase assembly factor 2 [Pseudosulfitobacter pseudonitzschiae]MBM2316950.1 succinate dehydrogenase assemb